MNEVVGRDRELALLASRLDEEHPAGFAPVFLLSGEAGVGKTTLWRAATDLAGERGYRVLRCAPAGAETQLAFTGVRDLLGDAFDEVADDLPEPQRRALAVTLLREEPPAHAVDLGAITVAFAGALRLLAGPVRLIVAVDDVQWLDPASAAIVAYALRRLDDAPIAFALALRAGERDPLEVERLAPERVETLRVGGLSFGALGRLIHDRLERTYALPTLRRLHDVSGGNAFYALEIARALPDDPPPARSGVPLPVPGSLRQLVAERLSLLPADTISALAVVAALGRARLGLVSELLGDSRPLLEPALAGNVIEIDGDRVRFAHPLFAACVYELSSLRHAELHARLAEVVTDPEERARHLALANEQPSEEVAALVEHGAELAFSRGSPGAAAELAREAVRLTPSRNGGAAARRALAEVDYHFAAGSTGGAADRLDELLARSAPGAARAALLSRLGRLRHFERDIGASVGLLYEALREAGSDDALRGEIEEGLAWGLLLSRRDLTAAAEHATSAVALARARGDDASLAEALAVSALTDFVLGRSWEETMDAALALEHATLHLRVLRQPSFAHGYVLSCADELDRARDVFERLLRRAADAGDESSVPSLLNHLALVECLAGRWLRASEHAAEGYERALESGQQPTQVSILGKSALLAARRGSEHEARARAAEAVGGELDSTDPAAVMERGGETVAWALGSLELALGRPEAAHARLGAMTHALLAAGVREPGELRCLPDEIEALLQLERVDDAEELLAHLRAWAERLERPSALAATARCTGLLHAARGDGDAALGELERAADLAERAALPYELARNLLALGAQQRRTRQRRAARETLQRALAVADELGAGLLAAAIRAEAARIGGRAAAAADELTAAERRIAELVAAGNTNKEVAAALVVSVRTVESALTQVYRKLDVRSRTELARKLARAD